MNNTSNLNAIRGEYVSYHFDDAYREEVTLEDDSKVLLRCVQPSDKIKLLDGLERLSPESRYTRFFTAKPYLTEKELEFLTEVDGIDHFAMGALKLSPKTAEGKGDGIGIVRFMRLKDDPGTAEPAITVIDEEQGKGLGRILFFRLVAAARERGIDHFQCEIMANNEPARHLIREMAPDADFEQKGAEVLVRFHLPPITVESLHSSGHEPHGPLYHAFRFAAAGELMVRGAFTTVRRFFESGEGDR